MFAIGSPYAPAPTVAFTVNFFRCVTVPARPLAAVLLRSSWLPLVRHGSSPSHAVCSGELLRDPAFCCGELAVVEHPNVPRNCQCKYFHGPSDPLDV